MVNILRVRAKIPAMLERCGYKVVIALSANMYPMYPCYSLPVLPPPRHCPMSFLQRITLHTMQRAWDASFQCQCYSLPYWSRAPVSLWNGIYYLWIRNECCHPSRDEMWPWALVLQLSDIDWFTLHIHHVTLLFEQPSWSSACTRLPAATWNYWGSCQACAGRWSWESKEWHHLVDLLLL